MREIYFKTITFTSHLQPSARTDPSNASCRFCPVALAFFLFEKPQRQSARFVTKINQRLLTSGGYVDLRILCFPKIWKLETHSVDRVPQEFKLNFWHFHAGVRY